MKPMEWDADLYENEHGFVSEHGKDLLTFIPKKPGTRVLDVGCGTGTLAAKLVDEGLRVVGIDESPEMIAKAQALYPDIDFRVEDALSMEFSSEFDVVFSNAVFHWIPDHTTLLRHVRKALIPGGKLVCEFGGVGNIVRIQRAFERSLERRNITYTSPFEFPELAEFKQLLFDAGFVVELINIADRITPLKGGARGMRTWVEQFFEADLSALPEVEQARIIAEMEDELQSALWDGQRWSADYRRLRVVATAL